MQICGLIVPTQSDADRVSTKFPGYTLSELNEGKALFEKNCNLCHKLKNPTSKTEEQWRKIVPRMTANVNKKQGNVLDETSQDKILKYLITMSSAHQGK